MTFQGHHMTFTLQILSGLLLRSKLLQPFHVYVNRRGRCDGVDVKYDEMFTI